MDSYRKRTYAGSVTLDVSKAVVLFFNSRNVGVESIDDNNKGFYYAMFSLWILFGSAF